MLDPPSRTPAKGPRVKAKLFETNPEWVHWRCLKPKCKRQGFFLIYILSFQIWRQPAPPGRLRLHKRSKLTILHHPTMTKCFRREVANLHQSPNRHRKVKSQSLVIKCDKDYSFSEPFLRDSIYFDQSCAPPQTAWPNQSCWSWSTPSPQWYGGCNLWLRRGRMVVLRGYGKPKQRF